MKNERLSKFYIFVFGKNADNKLYSKGDFIIRGF